jgi:nucleoside-diphosphate kinase
MSTELTLSIVKPDAVRKGVVGGCLAKLEEAGLRIAATKMIHLTRAQAEAFYAVHKERPFYGSLVEFMTSGPVVVSVLEGENAIAKNREVMGATDPAKAADGTIRKLYGANIENNAVHGSDAPETAKVEVAFFFGETELVNRAG